MANQYNLLPFTAEEIKIILKKARDGKMLTIEEYNALKNIQFGDNIQLDNYVTHAELQEILSQYAFKSYVNEKESTIIRYVDNQINNVLGSGGGSGGSADLSAYQTRVSENLYTYDKTIEGAINELFQFASSGKETIAAAIGSPLSKSDTFTAMGNKINTLSTDLAASINKSSLTTAMAIEKLGPLTNKAINVINELLDKNSEGKQLIAEAIGEPLNSSDTFRAMSEDINGLLNTFKTNMMNKGVAVENEDKFKSLIDKITTLGGEEENTAYIERGSLSNQGVTNGNVITFTARNLAFTPSLIYVTAGGVSEQIDVDESVYYNTLTITNEDVYVGASSYNTIEVNIIDKGFEVKFISGSTGGTYSSLGWTSIYGLSYTAIK